ncbi:hypothetical protein P9112_003091 [Eukaryota sp. TZLM1-RC]
MSSRKRSLVQTKLNLAGPSLLAKKPRTQRSTWLQHESVFYHIPDNFTPTKKLAAFDFDGTLVKTASGRKFPTDPSDWKLFSSSVTAKLQQLSTDGYTICIFSNQQGVSSGKLSKSDLSQRMDQFTSTIGLPIAAFCALESDSFRKPCTGMFQFYCDNCILPDKSQSFYCGDAAGRIANKNRRKDFSASDRAFACNISFGKFLTPEQFFLDQPEEEPFEFGFNPADHWDKEENYEYDLSGVIDAERQNMIVLIGSPASGKSSIIARYFLPAGYRSVCRDVLGTSKAVLTKTNSILDQGKSVVIDSTNPTYDSRRPFLELAKERGITIKALIFKTNKKLNFHLNSLRKCRGERTVPPVAIHTWFSRFDTPHDREGFSDIFETDFYPVFENEKEKEEFYYIYS